MALTADLVVSAGTAILSNYNSILGDTYLGGGLLKVGNNDALGAGKFYLSGGELLATSNVTLNGQWDISNNVVVAAAHGKTLNAFVDWTMESHAALTFGAPGANGVVVWGLPAAISDPYTVDVAAGTLRSVGNGLDRLLFNAAETTVEAGATIDISAADARIGHLQGSGTITDKNAGRELDLGTSNFSGVIAGAIYLRDNGVDQSTLTGIPTTLAARRSTSERRSFSRRRLDRFDNGPDPRQRQARDQSQQRILARQRHFGEHGFS